METTFILRMELYWSKLTFSLIKTERQAVVVEVEVGTQRQRAKDWEE